MTPKIIDPEKVLDRGFNISPDTVLGFLIMILLIIIIILGMVIYFLWRQLNQERQRIISSDEKIINTVATTGQTVITQIKEFITLTIK